jgi:hypothetical protein
MGINYSIDAEARIVRLEYVGDTTVDELMATLRAIFRSPQYRPGFGFLADRRNADAPASDDAEHILAFMVHHRHRLVGGRWALVIGGPASHDMGRIGQTIAESGPMRVQVFQYIRNAERWLRETAPAHLRAPRIDPPPSVVG